MEQAKRREAVLELRAEGMTQQQIGEVLGVATSTVCDDLSHIRNRTNNHGENSVRNRKETENLEAWRAKHEAELLEENRREAFYRVSEESFHCFLAWNVEEFCASARELLKDEDFRYQFVKRTRLKGVEIVKIIKGAKTSGSRHP